jgi:hypothetical protein
MKTNVNCLGISEDSQTLTQFFTKDPLQRRDLSYKAEEILENMQHLLISHNDRKNIETDQGVWCCVKNNDVLYFGLVHFNYPDRLSFEMLKELKKLYDRFAEDQNLDDLKNNGQKLLEKYNQPEKFDKLSQAHNNVQGLKLDVKNNMDKLVDNQEDLHDLENQTENLQKNAQKFNKETKTLERVMFWKNFKFWIILVVLIILIIIIIVLAVKFG